MTIASLYMLTHWGRVTHIYVSKLTIIGSDNGLSPDRRQAIIWTNAGILLIGTLGTNFSETLIEILTFSFKKMRMKVSSANRRPFCLGLNVLNFRHMRVMASQVAGNWIVSSTACPGYQHSQNNNIVTHKLLDIYLENSKYNHLFT